MVKDRGLLSNCEANRYIHPKSNCLPYATWFQVSARNAGVERFCPLLSRFGSLTLAVCFPLSASSQPANNTKWQLSWR
jgi:hypothetical protein